METLTIEPHPAFGHGWRQCRDEEERNLDVQCKTLVELCFGGCVAWSEQSDASVVDEDVDVTVACLSGPLDQVLGRFEVAQRNEPEHRAASAAFDLGDHVFGSLFVASDYQYVSAAGGQGDSCSLADPARRARNQSCLTSLDQPYVASSSRIKWVVQLTLTVRN